jgi:hypothetical protein
MAKPVERRKAERADDAETWTEDERKALLKVGPLFEKWLTRSGKTGKKKEKSFLEELGISL